jgi:hypothetical protein
VHLLRRRATGPRHAGLGVDDHVVDQARARERREREQRGGRVAARVGDELGADDVLAIELGQAVDGPADQLGRFVIAVPAAVHVEVAQAEVSTEIDNAYAPLPE